MTASNSTSQQVQTLEAELAALRAALQPLAGLPHLAAPLQEQIAAKEREIAALRGAAHGPKVDRPSAERDVIIGTYVTVHNSFFGDTSPPDGERLLNSYLRALIGECSRLYLQRITGHVQGGHEQAKTPQQLRLQEVYTSLTTNGDLHVRFRTMVPFARQRQFVERLTRTPRNPDAVRPERVMLMRLVHEGRDITTLVGEGYPERPMQQPEDIVDETPVVVELVRPELALEAIHDQRLLVLLGEPGAGKSTVLRYLALLIARRLLGEPGRIPGWNSDTLPVPILVPLAQVARALEAGGSADEALWRTLGDLLDGALPLRAGLRDHLQSAMSSGGVLLLCDGLDELPAGAPDSPRVQVAAALRRLAASSDSVRMVVTSRVLPYQTPGDWKLTRADGWAERTIQPLAFGQVKTFVQSWYAALAGDNFGLTPAQTQERAATLISQLQARQSSLEPLIRSPLLLTMLALLHLNAEEVPNDEAQLYEECVRLLLERWEPVRQPNMERPGLIERLGSPPGLTLALLRGPLHRLAYEAHRDARSETGRGLIDAAKLRGVMLTFFTNLQGSANAGQQVETFVRVLREEAGLLLERGDDTVAFPHLTFQEYLAACHLAGLPTMQQDAYAFWRGDDRERWRKVLQLLAARLREDNKAATEGVAWLRLLTAPTISDTQRKTPVQRRRDALLAALSYQAIGARAAFAGLFNPEREVIEPLREACTLLLETPDPAILLADRIMVAEVLGAIGDQRYPVAPVTWRRSLRSRRPERFASGGKHYWRYVPAGRYCIGENKTVEHNLDAFWIARFPITTAQFTAFVADGYCYDRYWTKEGWNWRRKRPEPDEWNNPKYRQPNQPMTIVTWYEATAYCAWLHAQMAAELPAGYVLRLPTEAEWEAAAAYVGPEQRRTYPWGSESEPTLAHAVYDEAKLNAAAPIGCCPAGAAACGALDMAGNVWEWCSSPHGQYPAGAYTWAEDFTIGDWDIPVRGGAWTGSRFFIRFEERFKYTPIVRSNDNGFRVSIAPALA